MTTTQDHETRLADEVLTAWDEVNSAARRVLISLPSQMTEAAEKLDRERLNMHEVLMSSFRAADSRAKEIAGLLDQAADELENASLYHLSDFRVGCTRCDGKVGDDPGHDGDCLIARMRSAADHAAKDRTHE